MKAILRLGDKGIMFSGEIDVVGLLTMFTTAESVRVYSDFQGGHTYTVEDQRPELVIVADGEVERPKTQARYVPDTEEKEEELG